MTMLGHWMRLCSTRLCAARRSGTRFGSTWCTSTGLGRTRRCSAWLCGATRAGVMGCTLCICRRCGNSDSDGEPASDGKHGCQFAILHGRPFSNQTAGTFFSNDTLDNELSRGWRRHVVAPASQAVIRVSPRRVWRHRAWPRIWQQHMALRRTSPRHKVWRSRVSQHRVLRRFHRPPCWYPSHRRLAPPALRSCRCLLNMPQLPLPIRQLPPASMPISVSSW